jgi:hypothetical protein
MKKIPKVKTVIIHPEKVQDLASDKEKEDLRSIGIRLKSLWIPMMVKVVRPVDYLELGKIYFVKRVNLDRETGEKIEGMMIDPELQQYAAPTSVLLMEDEYKIVMWRWNPPIKQREDGAQCLTK